MSGSHVIQVVSMGGKGRNQENSLVSGLPKELQNTSLTEGAQFVETNDDIKSAAKKRTVANNRKVLGQSSVSSRLQTNLGKKERNDSIISQGIVDELLNAAEVSNSNARQNTVQDNVSEIMSPFKSQQPRIGNAQVALN